MSLNLTDIPLNIRYSALCYWAGVFTPLAGLILEFNDIPYAFSVSGLLLGAIAVYYAYAARKVSNYIAITQEAIRHASGKSFEASQSVFQAQTLMRQAKEEGDFERMAQLVDSGKNCELISAQFRSEEERARSVYKRMVHSESELVQTEWAFGIASAIVMLIGSIATI